MKTRRSIEVFSLSFLDVISCGFGAIILLLVLSLALERKNLERISSDAAHRKQEIESERVQLSDKSQALMRELENRRERLIHARQVHTKFSNKYTSIQKKMQIFRPQKTSNKAFKMRWRLCCSNLQKR